VAVSFTFGVIKKAGAMIVERINNMNPEEWYDKKPINDTEVELCLEDAECFDDFCDLLEKRELYIELDIASDLWAEYIN